MNQSFDIEIAKEYGILEAIILQDIYFWVRANEENERNFRNGKYWTYNSIKGFASKYIYASEKQIRTALNHLRDKGLIAVGDFSTDRFKRPLWYTVTELGEQILTHDQQGETLCPEGQDEFAQKDMSCCPRGQDGVPQRATDNNIYINNNISNNKSNYKSNDISNTTQTEGGVCEPFEEEFETLWERYPRKDGKKDALRHYRSARRNGVPYQTISEGLYRYIEYIEMNNTQPQFIKTGSSWFCGHHWDDEYRAVKKGIDWDNV